jgi:hypothetical protein
LGRGGCRRCLGTAVSLGATTRTSVQEVGEGIKVATVLDPFGNIFGVIENPHFIESKK